MYILKYQPKLDIVKVRYLNLKENLKITYYWKKYTDANATEKTKFDSTGFEAIPTSGVPFFFSSSSVASTSSYVTVSAKKIIIWPLKS